MPECFIDTTLVSLLLDAKVNHKHSCSEVVREMEKGKYRDAFAVGIIDNDKRKLSYISEFNDVGHTDNLTFLKHKTKHHYIVKVGKEHKAMESFIIANVETIGRKMEDFDLPSNLGELIETTKDSISSQKDQRINKLCKEICLSPEVTKLRKALIYLASKRYEVDIDDLKDMIKDD